jgi:hypothetical protein
MAKMSRRQLRQIIMEQTSGARGASSSESFVRERVEKELERIYNEIADLIDQMVFEGSDDPEPTSPTDEIYEKTVKLMNDAQSDIKSAIVALSQMDQFSFRSGMKPDVASRMGRRK